MTNYAWNNLTPFRLRRGADLIPGPSFQHPDETSDLRGGYRINDRPSNRVGFGNTVLRQPPNYVPFQSMFEPDGRHAYNPAARQYPRIGRRNEGMDRREREQYWDSVRPDTDRWRTFELGVRGLRPEDTYGLQSRDQPFRPRDDATYTQPGMQYPQTARRGLDRDDRLMGSARWEWRTIAPADSVQGRQRSEISRGSAVDSRHSRGRRAGSRGMGAGDRFGEHGRRSRSVSARIEDRWPRSRARRSY